MPNSNPIGLTRDQEQDYLKFGKVLAYFSTTTNAPKVNGYQPLKDEYDKFVINMGSVAPIAQGKIVTTKGETQNKNSLKHAVAVAVGVYAPVSRGFCLRSDVNMPTEA